MVILLILMSMGLIKYGDTARNCPPSFSIDDGNDGRQYCRPAQCGGNKCLENVRNVTCKNVTGNDEILCKMNIDMKFKWVSKDKLVCAVKKGQEKYISYIFVISMCKTKLKNENCEGAVGVCEIIILDCPDHNITCHARMYFEGMGEETIFTKFSLDLKITPINSLNNEVIPGSILNCELNDLFNSAVSLLEIRQNCSDLLYPLRNVCKSQPCSLRIIGFLGKRRCSISCKAIVTNATIVTMASLQTEIKHDIIVAYPYRTNFMIDHGGTIVRGNDIISRNDTMLSCSPRLFNANRLNATSGVLLHIRFFIHCSSIKKVIECQNISSVIKFGCSLSISQCQFLDRVYLSCADYYSKKSNKMMLYRRIDGAWGDWWPWTSWDPPCGKGGTSTRNKTRRCDSPYPRNGGKNCTDKHIMTETSILSQDCIDFGGWSHWSEWSTCSLSCNRGIRFKRRSCNNTKPSSGGKNCIGLSSLTRNCMIISCADYHRRNMAIGFVGFLLGIPALVMLFLVIYSVCKGRHHETIPFDNERSPYKPDIMYPTSFCDEDY